MTHDAIGLDIGGANIKAATVSGEALCRPFELWRAPDKLYDELCFIRDHWSHIPNIAVTMTGELCDCFETKRDGVRHILASVRRAFGELLIRVWTNQGDLVPLDLIAGRKLLQVASANWLALATYAGRLAPNGAGLLIDVGSTTTDIIPILDGLPIPKGRNDIDRMRAGELVYTGVRRTPICALLGPAVAAEWFATTYDAYVWLGHLPSDPDDIRTPDGRPMTFDHAHARLARMLGGDSEIMSIDDTRKLADNVFGRQRAIIVKGIRSVVGRLKATLTSAIVSGSGEFLARAAWTDFAGENAQVISLSQTLGDKLTEAACAYAVAVLDLETTSCEDDLS